MLLFLSGGFLPGCDSPPTLGWNLSFESQRPLTDVGITGTRPEIHADQAVPAQPHTQGGERPQELWRSSQGPRQGSCGHALRREWDGTSCYRRAVSRCLSQNNRLAAVFKTSTQLSHRVLSRLGNCDSEWLGPMPHSYLNAKHEFVPLLAFQSQIPSP